MCRVLKVKTLIVLHKHTHGHMVYFFSCSTTLKLFLWRMPIERCRQVHNSVDVSFHILFSAWSFVFVLLFSCSSRVKVLGFFSFVLPYYLCAKIPCIIILLKPLADLYVVLSVYFSLLEASHNNISTSFLGMWGGRGFPSGPLFASVIKHLLLLFSFCVPVCEGISQGG